MPSKHLLLWNNLCTRYINRAIGLMFLFKSFIDGSVVLVRLSVKVAGAGKGHVLSTFQTGDMAHLLLWPSYWHCPSETRWDVPFNVSDDENGAPISNRYSLKKKKKKLQLLMGTSLSHILCVARKCASLESWQSCWYSVWISSFSVITSQNLLKYFGLEKVNIYGDLIQISPKVLKLYLIGKTLMKRVTVSLRLRSLHCPVSNNYSFLSILLRLV